MVTATMNDETRYRAVVSLPPELPSSIDPLFDAIHDASWRVRKAAVERLTRVPEPGALIPRLVATLGEYGQTGARNSAAEALTAIGAAAIPALVALVSHADPDQRKFAVDILGAIGSPDAAGALAHAVQDADPNVRLAAVEALGRTGGPDAVQAIEGVLRLPDSLLRLAALEALVALRRPPPLPLLSEMLEEPTLTAAAYRVLGLVPLVSATERICAGFRHERKSTQDSALAALGLQRSVLEGDQRTQAELVLRNAVSRVPNATALITRGLESEDSNVRAGALFVAGVVRTPELAIPVAEAARDEVLAREVARTLECLGPAAARDLLSRLEYLSVPARAAAAEALEALSHPALVDALETLLDYDDPELQLAAVRALGTSQSAKAIPLLVRALRSSSLGAAAARSLVFLGGVERDAVQKALEEDVQRDPTAPGLYALARVGGAAALGPLRAALRHPVEAVRGMAAQAVSEVGGADALELIKVALNDESPFVRTAAVRGIAALKVPSASLEPLLKRALSDVDPVVQGAAIDAAGDARAVALAADLEAHATSSDGRRAARALRALSRLGRVTAPVLQGAIGHPDTEVVKEALTAGSILPEGAGLALTVLRHSHWDVRAAAARVLASCGDKSCLEPLEQALAAEVDPMARAALAEAIRRVGRA